MHLTRREFAVLSGVALLLAACSTEGTPAKVPRAATGHPRLLVRESDLARLRGWATDANPVYRDGLAVLVNTSKQQMDDGTVPAGDGGTAMYEQYPTEWYAELFAFMSLIDPDEAARADYGRRARDLLMFVIDKAADGVGAEDDPFRNPRFATTDRSRWHGEAYGLTVDWAYPYFSADDKVRIHGVFSRWAREQFAAYPAAADGGGALDFTVDGPVNDGAMLEDRLPVRWAMNNYFMGHMRNLGFMALAFDPADDPDGELGGYLRNATGQWLYMSDQATRTDSAGGLSAEGTEYTPTALGYYAQLMAALHTSGHDDPDEYGPQVVLADNPFWSDYLPAQLHTLPPNTSPGTEDRPDLGPRYEAATFGDLETYAAPDLTATLAPLAIMARDRGDTAMLDTIRWHITNVPAGGADMLMDRIGNSAQFFPAILSFLTLDPGASTDADPRSTLPLDYRAPGLNRYLSRTSWSDDGRLFTYALSWKAIDHQGGDGNEFEFHRNGEWLTKKHTGYDTSWFTDYHNSVTIENAPLAEVEGTFQQLAQRGSQVPYEPAGDPELVAQSSSDAYFHATGDATNLYNSPPNSRTEVSHASRSVVWLKPDHIVVYDRAETSTDGRFKRFWLQSPAAFDVTGGQAMARTPGGQQLISTTLLPEGAIIEGSPAETDVGTTAVGEPMKFRLMVEAPGSPRSARFLHVIQGADGDAGADAVALVRGDAYEGAAVGDTAVVFPVVLGKDVTGTSLSVPAGVKRLLVTGLAPDTGYRTDVSGIEVRVQSGGDSTTDGGGVLTVEL
jgi:hypothetical protein